MTCSGGLFALDVLFSANINVIMIHFHFILKGKTVEFSLRVYHVNNKLVAIDRSFLNS